MPKRTRSPGRKIRKLEKRLKKYKEQEEKEAMEYDQESVEVVEPTLPEDMVAADVEPTLPEDMEEADTSDNVEEALCIAEALGEPPEDDLYSEDIHTNLALAMEAILEKGLSKAEKDKLSKLKIPNNCKLLQAPKMNIELSSILTPAAKNRDKLLQERQQELGLSAGNVVRAIQDLSKKEFSKTDVIKKLGETSRLICNLHFCYTDIRRRLISPFLDKNLTENLKENRRGENLYSNLEESVKSFSAIKRASNVIKPRTLAGNKSVGIGINNNVRNTKNYQLPRRQFQNYHNKRGAFHQRNQQHQRQAFKDRTSDNSRHQPGSSTRGRAKYP